MIIANLIVLSGCSSETADEPMGASVSQPPARQRSELPPLPPPHFETGTCRIESAPAGLRVFVDGRPVFDHQGNPIITPCRVTAEAGPHTVTLAGEQYHDFSRQVRFDSENEFHLTASVREGTSETLQQPLLGMPAGQPLPLATLNSTGNEFDPFVAADGRSIWFAGDRAEGRGIYVATRSGPYATFGDPQLVRLTRGADQPASPSVTSDALSIVYTLRGKARIWGLTRQNPLQPFSDRVPLHFSSDTGEAWPTCQITGDGERIYYEQQHEQEIETRVVLRSGPKETFSRVLVVDMPGGVPCLSSDGLRQYVYDGHQLLRSRRESVRKPFRDAVPILELELPNFVATPGYRQYFVTDDEQWMFYADDPAANGDLYVVRLSDQPGWGLPLLGKAVQPGEAVPESGTADSPQVNRPMETGEEKLSAEPVKTDDRLPYTRFRAEFQTLIGEKRYREASDLIDRAASDPELTPARKLLGWDRDDIDALIGFEDDVERVIASLVPGDEIRLGTYRFELVEASPAALTLKGKTREIVRKITDLDPSDVARIVDATIGDDDSPVKLRLAVFAMYLPGLPQSTRQRYAENAGAAGKRLQEEHAQRLLQQVEWELDRQRTTRAKELLGAIEARFPESESARRASDMRDSLYTRIEWNRRGRRNWQTGPSGEFTASDDRADGSLLVSPQRYDHFELTMEYRTNSPTGQGGVFFRYTGSGRPYDNAFKIQLSNDRGIAADPYCTGALFSYDAPSMNAARPQGEWSPFRMLVEGTRVTVEIDGTQVLETTASDPEIPESGYVALDGIAGGISYRKVLITDLSGVSD